MAAATTIIMVAAAVVAAAAAGYGTYAASEAAAQQAKDQKNAAHMQADAERAAGNARAAQVRYKTERAMSSLLSRQGAAGVQISEGSLLENEMQYASDAEYDAQMAAYPHVVGAQVDDYHASLFGTQERRIRSTQALNTGVAVGSSLASSYSAVSKGWNGGPSSSNLNQSWGTGRWGAD